MNKQATKLVKNPFLDDEGIGYKANVAAKF